MKTITNVFIFLSFYLLIAPVAQSHHYKGLPHYSYFENYPQVPILEFTKETSGYEIFITVYNFQGMDMKEVDSPDDVRFYIYIYDIENDQVYKGNADFNILAGDQQIYSAVNVPSQQENIFVIQRKISEQDDLTFSAAVIDKNGSKVNIELPISISKTFFQKYGMWILIAGFFALIAIIKTFIGRVESVKPDLVAAGAN